MPRRKKAECPFTLCGQSPKNGDIIELGVERLLVLRNDDGGWDIKPIPAPNPPMMIVPAEYDFTPGAQYRQNLSADDARRALFAAKPPGAFYIDTAGVARNAKGREILPSDVTDILLDTRPEAEREDVTKIKWADGVPRKFGELCGITIAGA